MAHMNNMIKKRMVREDKGKTVKVPKVPMMSKDGKRTQATITAGYKGLNGN